jgi:hypothetical protein
VFPLSCVSKVPDGDPEMGVEHELAVGEKVRSGVGNLGVARHMAAAQNWKKVPDGAPSVVVGSGMAVGEKVRSGVTPLGVEHRLAAAQNWWLTARTPHAAR